MKLLDVLSAITFCHLCLPFLLPPLLSHIPIFYVYLYSPFFYFLIWYLFLSSSPSFRPRHPGQLFIQTGCLQLSVQSCISRGRLCSLRCKALSQHLCLLSICSICALNMTLTPRHCFLPNHPCTLPGGSPEEITLQKMYWINDNTT